MYAFFIDCEWESRRKARGKVSQVGVAEFLFYHHLFNTQRRLWNGEISRVSTIDAQTHFFLVDIREQSQNECVHTKQQMQVFSPYSYEYEGLNEIRRERTGLWCTHRLSRQVDSSKTRFNEVTEIALEAMTNSSIADRLHELPDLCFLPLSRKGGRHRTRNTRGHGCGWRARHL